MLLPKVQSQLFVPGFNELAIVKTATKPDSIQSRGKRSMPLKDQKKICSWDDVRVVKDDEIGGKKKDMSLRKR